MQEDKITSRQMILFLTVTRVSLAISVMPILNLPPYNQDIWIMIMVSAIYTFILMIPLLYLTNKFNNHSLVGYMKILFGNVLGKIVGMLFGLFFLVTVVNGATIQSELVASTILMDASNISILTLMLITCIYVVSRGILTIVRSSEFLTPLSLFIVISMIALGLNNVDFSIVFPILKDSSFVDINLGALRLTFYYSDIFLLTMIAPELEKKEDLNKIFIKATIYSLLILMATVIAVQGTLGIELARHTNFPFLFYARSINIFRVFERIEAVFIIGWLITSLGRNVGFLYITVRIFRDIFNKKEDSKIIVFIVGTIATVVSMLILNWRSVIGIRKYFDILLYILFVIFVIAIPIIACIVYFIRRKSLKEEDKPMS